MRSQAMVLIDKDKPLGKFVWRCADCGYIYGRDILVELEDSIKRRRTADYDGHGDMETLIDKAVIDLREMRTALKQCRKALGVALCGTPGPDYFRAIETGLRQNMTEIKSLASAAMERINSIIPPSEV